MADVERIVGYRVDREISRSSIASVYQGYQESLQREVLIKRLHPQFVSDPEIRARFEREAHALARIKHKNIVHIYDYRADDDLMLLVQEWIGGGSVAELMRSNGPLEEKEAIALAMDVLEGLEVAHEAGVIHRDIKPSNLMLAEGGSIKITDFGLAHFEGSPTLTQQGAIMGTPAYMAPEMVNGQAGTTRCDLYSFGVTLYEVLTGENPFQAEHISQTLQRVLSVKPAKLEGVHDGTNRLLLSLMAKDPNQRPASATAALETLRPLARELGSEEGWETVELPPARDVLTNGDGTPVPVRDTATHTIRPVRKTSRSRRFIFLAWAAMVLIATAVLLYNTTDLFQQGSSEDALPSDPGLAITDPEAEPTGSGEVVNDEPDATDFEQTSPDETLPDDEPPAGSGEVGGEDTGAEQQDIARETEQDAAEPPSVEGEDLVIDDADEALADGGGDTGPVDLPVTIPPLDPVVSNDSGYVMIMVQPWAHIYFNDRRVGTTPLSEHIQLPSGRVRIAFVNPQFPRVERDFRVPSGGDSTLYNVDLYAEVSIIIFIDAIPWAQVSLNGEYIGDTPIASPILVPPGDHTLLFHHPELKDETVTFTAHPGEEHRFRPNLYD